MSLARTVASLAVSLRVSVAFFALGLLGIALGVQTYLDTPDHVRMVCVALGLGLWFIAALSNFLYATLRMIRHLKKSWAITKAFRAEQAIESETFLQCGPSEAEAKARQLRRELWRETILGTRD